MKSNQFQAGLFDERILLRPGLCVQGSLKTKSDYMERIKKGWVVACVKHYVSGESWICEESFADTQEEAVILFTTDIFGSWEQWMSYGFKAIEATRSITVKLPEHPLE